MRFHRCLYNKNNRYAFEGIISAFEIAEIRGHEDEVLDLGYIIDEGLYKLGGYVIRYSLFYSVVSRGDVYLRIVHYYIFLLIGSLLLSFEFFKLILICYCFCSYFLIPTKLNNTQMKYIHFKINRWQVNGPLCHTNQYLVRHPTNDVLPNGGVMNARNQSALRIDTTQHHTHALIMAGDVIYKEDFFNKEEF
jgi:uncharacterized membrane protein